MSRVIDLNADLGEGAANDADLMHIITSCNIACGGHAGDEATMRTALGLAQKFNVCAGAHPSFPDRGNFGRTKSDLQGQALESAFISQIGALRDIAQDIGVRLTHLKPHGALYNMAAIDRGLAESVVNVLKETLPNAALVGPPNSELENAARSRSVSFIAEGFADRAYDASGALLDRSQEGAVLTDHAQQAKQALQLVRDAQVTTFTGLIIPFRINTICIHGDTPGAVEAARAIRAQLEQNGVTICRAI